jgi:hypothetical protein
MIQPTPSGHPPRRRSPFRTTEEVPVDSDDAGPGTAGSLAPSLRWLGRLAVVALGLLFIMDGLRGTWAAADVVSSGLLVAAAVLGVAFLLVGLLHLARRGRGG